MIVDGDLILKPEQGFAYQADLRAVEYQDSYLDKFTAYDCGIEREVNAGRFSLVARHLRIGSSLLDYGAGSGSFVNHARRRGYVAKGFEVIPGAVSSLKDEGIFSHEVENFDAVTTWDVLEHLPKPEALLRRVRSFLFVSIPVFDDLTEIRKSKHYRPGEHLFYFTDAGFVAFVEGQGFELLERSSHEVDAGRDSIGAYAFRR